MSDIEAFCAGFRAKIRAEVINFMSSCIQKTEYKRLSSYGLRNITFSLSRDEVLSGFKIATFLDDVEHIVSWTDNSSDFETFMKLSREDKAHCITDMEDFVTEFLPLISYIFDTEEEIKVPIPESLMVIDYLNKMTTREKFKTHRELAIHILENGDFKTLTIFDVQNLIRDNVNIV